MHPPQLYRKPVAALLVALAVLVVAGAAAAAQRHRHHHHDGLREARAATERFRDAGVARRAGYMLMRDAAGIACIDNPGVGAMGDHLMRMDLVADPALHVRKPEALVYEPTRDGGLRLGALEYVTPQAAWDAAHDDPPSLFGRRLTLVPAPNRFGLPAFYELHVWLYRHNPRGVFDDWNSDVTCAFG